MKMAAAISRRVRPPATLRPVESVEGSPPMVKRSAPPADTPSTGITQNFRPLSVRSSRAPTPGPVTRMSWPSTSCVMSVKGPMPVGTGCSNSRVSPSKGSPNMKSISLPASCPGVFTIAARGEIGSVHGHPVVLAHLDFALAFVDLGADVALRQRDLHRAWPRVEHLVGGVLDREHLADDQPVLVEEHDDAGAGAQS